MRTSLTILKEARELLSDPKRWTKGAMCRVIDTRAVTGVRHQENLCYCAVGAIELFSNDGPYNDESGKPAELLERELDHRGDGRGVVTFNDHGETTHRDILGLFDDTIARASAA